MECTWIMLCICAFESHTDKSGQRENGEKKGKKAERERHRREIERKC